MRSGIRMMKLLIQCPDCEEEYWYSIHPENLEYIKCKNCCSILKKEVDVK